MKHSIPMSLHAISETAARPSVRGKFLYVGDEKCFVKGVTYGTFASNEETGDFPPQDRVAQDFQAMAEAGINTVRVYIIPPRWLLDTAAEFGLRVFVGMPWEQHIDFLGTRGRSAEIRKRLKSQISEISGHPAILAYAVGNEIPASVVRWSGAGPISAFLGDLAAVVHQSDPGALVTYVNFPTTEYLDLRCVDFVSFNVYLEDMDQLSAYLARLQNIAGEKPLLMAEIGLDSLRNGTDLQASSLAKQIRTAFEAGVVGTFIFAWTDEWNRGGFEIEDWDFGLVTRERAPKPALTAVQDAYRDAPLADRDWPRMSVIVCSYNGSRTIGETLDRLGKLDYPDYEVIVVNDGSTDRTGEVAAGFPVQLITTENRGLSNARNTGMEAATGDYVVYIDDDAYPDPHWLKYLALAFATKDFAAVGGPNIAPPEDGDLSECVANAPGGPIHVLSGDTVAEHIPGCNMAFRRSALMAIGGFDGRFRTAGDDVDACWRIEEDGGVIGFSHAAVVWHHRRPSIKTYLKQQRGYARAESLLAEKWPNRYNRAGHLSWRGQLYGRGRLQSLFTPQHIYHGSWGLAPFQSVYARGETVVTALPLMPEWFAIVGLLLLVGVFGFDWPPLFIALALGLAGGGISIVMAAKGASEAQFNTLPGAPPRRPDWQLKSIVFFLYLLQPAARLIGRIRYRLGPWSAGKFRLTPVPKQRRATWWTESWTAPETVLQRIHAAVTEIPHVIGGDYDDWDLAVGPSVFGEVRLVVMQEEHGGGRQLFRMRAWPVVFGPALSLVAFLTVLGIGAAFAGALIAATALFAGAALATGTIYSALSTATHQYLTTCEAAFADVPEEAPDD